jgi:hypothetical protein
MKNLEGSRDELVGRLSRVEPDTPRRWGTMSAHEMICHVSDLFRVALGERDARDHTGPLQRTVVKWLALRLPVGWPRNLPTLPEARAGREGTPPGEFAIDRDELVRLMDRFLEKGGGFRPHPLFGPLSRNEWMRWAHLHTDHHLRQFGV